jgi:large subunit ribosomal protein L29
MARQKAEDLRQLKTDELAQKLAVLREEGFRLRFRSGTEAITNPLQFRSIRRDIARIETILRERRQV